jgi:hypothetical protein
MDRTCSAASSELIRFNLSFYFSEFVDKLVDDDDPGNYEVLTAFIMYYFMGVAGCDEDAMDAVSYVSVFRNSSFGPMSKVSDWLRRLRSSLIFIIGCLFVALFSCLSRLLI